jgi:hypothetical protein
MPDLKRFCHFKPWRGGSRQDDPALPAEKSFQYQANRYSRDHVYDAGSRIENWSRR